MVDVKCFDAEIANNGDFLTYVVGPDNFLYTARLGKSPSSTTWRKGKTVIPLNGTDQGNAYLLVYAGAAYYLDGNQLLISTNLGDDWTPCAPLSFRNLRTPWVVTRQNIVVGDMNDFEAADVSNDGGKSWSQPSMGDYGNGRITRAIGSTKDGAWIGAGTDNGVLLSNDGASSWTRFTHADNPNLQDSTIGKVFFRQTANALYVYFAQEAGISYGILEASSKISVDWLTPFTNIPNWDYKMQWSVGRDNVSALPDMEGETFQLGLMNTTTMQFIKYDVLDTGSITPSLISPVSYANASTAKTEPRLKMLGDPTFGTIFYLNADMVLSQSGDGGATFQTLDITI